MRSGPALATTCLTGLALVLSTATIARQDAGGLASATRGMGWGSHLVALPAESLDADDLSRARPATAGDPFGGGFAIAALAPEKLPPIAEEDPPPPFMDRTLRGDRLAPPVQGHDATTEFAYAESSPAVAAQGSTGSDGRHGSTPAYPVASTATPSSGEEPVAVAALPVLTPAERLALQVRFTPANTQTFGGVTQAERGSGADGTRLAHTFVIPEAELAKQQKCLAEAVYFEARGESERGQYAVAQVVMNRTRTGFYPSTICKVVYQNKHRYNACQFSFACDRFPDRIYNREAWALAQRIARDVTENGAWLDDVGGATHYHANYVRPYWRRAMIREAVIGRHIFYRARSLPQLGPPAAISAAGSDGRSGEAS